jgi:hypothetical protein
VYVNSGAVEYTRLSELYESSPSLPDDVSATEIAIEFLKSHGLWHEDLTPEDTAVGGTYNGETSHLIVRFTRNINGMPLTGPGNKFGIRIGDKGKIIRILLWYPEVVVGSNAKTIDLNTAFSKLKTGDGLVNIPFGCKKVVISDVSLGYYLEDITKKQESLKPCYVFKGECLDAQDKYMSEFTGWINAIAE